MRGITLFGARRMPSPLVLMAGAGCWPGKPLKPIEAGGGPHRAMGAFSGLGRSRVGRWSCQGAASSAVSRSTRWRRCGWPGRMISDLRARLDLQRQRPALSGSADRSERRWPVAALLRVWRCPWPEVGENIHRRAHFLWWVSGLVVPHNIQNPQATKLSGQRPCSP